MRQMKNKSILIIISLSLFFVIVFSSMSIYNALKFNNNLYLFKEHPFSVSDMLYKIQGYNSENRIRINRLTMYSTDADINIVKNALDELHDLSYESFYIVKERFLGVKDDVAKLNEAINELYRAEDEFLDNAKLMTHDEIKDYIDSNLTKLSDDIDVVSNRMLDFAKNKAESITENSESLLMQTVMLTVIFVAIILVISVLLYREYIQKIKERSYRDFLFDVLAMNIDNVFLLYNKKKGMEYVFANSERIVGISDSEIYDEPYKFFNYLESEDIFEWKERFEKNLITEQEEREVIYRNPKTHMSQWLSISIHPVSDNITDVRYIISLTDLTRQKRDQQALNDALINAQNASKAKSDFLSRMSHEIRTPMNAIMGMTTIAAASIDDTNKIEDCLSKISASSKHLLMLINDILDMSKIESGKLTITNEPFNILELIKSISSITYGQAKAKDLDFDIVVESLSYENLLGDSLRLRQVLLNILSNSIKYTNSGGKIEVTVQEVSNRIKDSIFIRFIISDTGIGMSEEFLKRIFDLFEQENLETENKLGSTGIGMVITKNIVTLMNGTILVDSNKGEGTTVYVEIPFGIEEGKSKPSKVNDEFENLDNIDYLDNIDLTGKRILIVEDNEINLEIAETFLELVGAEIECAYNGEEAVKMFLDNQKGYYDMILMDIQMPKMDGYEATRAIRKSGHPDAKLVPIVAMTANAFAEDVTFSIESGMNAHISKPIEIKLFYDTVKKYI